MDFSAIFQLRTKKFWWMDVIFYFVVSLLIATLLTYVVFLAKNSFLRSDIKKETAALQTVGTEQQKEYEKNVLNYQKKINDFSGLLKNHEFATNVFAFMQEQTMPSIWFKQFSLDGKSNNVQLTGESDDMDTFSRQVALFEKNKYVKSVATLNSAMGESARIDFNINLVLDQSIFGYLASTPIVETTSSSNQPLVQPAQNSETPPVTISQTLITSFHLLLTPEVVGAVDQTKHTITLTVPSGTNVKSLTPSIVMSPGATVFPTPGMPLDFSSPVNYIVTGQDGTIQNYKVTVNVNAPSQVQTKANKINANSIIFAIITLLVLVVIVAIILLIWNKIKGSKPKI